MGQYLGKRWKSMCEEEKELYDLLALSGETLAPTKKVKMG
jgi:hypothetical protein